MASHWSTLSNNRFGASSIPVQFLLSSFASVFFSPLLLLLPYRLSGDLVFFYISILSTLPYSNLVVVFGALEQRVPTSLRALIRCTRIFTHHLYLRPTGRLIPILIFSPSFSGLTWFFVSTISHFLVGYCGWCDRLQICSRIPRYLLGYSYRAYYSTLVAYSITGIRRQFETCRVFARCKFSALHCVCVFVAAELREFFST